MHWVESKKTALTDHHFIVVHIYDIQAFMLSQRKPTETYIIHSEGTWVSHEQTIVAREWWVMLAACRLQCITSVQSITGEEEDITCSFISHVLPLINGKTRSLIKCFSKSSRYAWLKTARKCFKWLRIEDCTPGVVYHRKTLLLLVARRFFQVWFPQLLTQHVLQPWVISHNLDEQRE